MLELQVKVLAAWHRAGQSVRSRMAADHEDRGDVTASTALTVILVVAALAAGAVVAARIMNNAEAIPEP
jgi:hypothetical protein